MTTQASLDLRAHIAGLFATALAAVAPDLPAPAIVIERTSGRSQVLCLLPAVPIPANTGGALRALGMLRALDRAFDVTALAWGREDEGREARHDIHGHALPGFVASGRGSGVLKRGP